MCLFMSLLLWRSNAVYNYNMASYKAFHYLKVEKSLGTKRLRSEMSASLFASLGLETYFNMHKYTELLTYLTKIRISEYKHMFIFRDSDFCQKCQ